MKYLFFLFNFLLIAQNFNYSNDDWFTFSNPGIITSITTTNDGVLFSSENGVYNYNEYTQELELLEDYIRNFNLKNYHIIHYDKFRDYLWLLHDDYLSFKPMTSSFWREIDFYEIDLNGHYNILNIGSDPEYVFINIGSGIIMLDPHTGRLIIEDEYDFGNINWTNTNRNIIEHNVDITNFYSLDGYNFISSNTIEYNGMIISVTSTKRDNNKLWIGTSSGELLLADLNLRSIEKILNLPLFSDINLTYVDNNDEFWLTTNDLIFINDEIFLGNNQIFVVRWLQNKNKWVNYYQNKFLNIRSKDVTSMIRKENKMYFGTKFGLLIFDIIKEKWTLIDETSGLTNNYINGIGYYNKKLYISTNMGINILSIIDNSLYLNHKFLDFNTNLFYNLKIKDNYLFLLGDFGFLKYDLKNRQKISLINDRFYLFDLIDSEKIILSNQNKLFKFIDEEINFISSIRNIKNIKQCDDNNLWINQGNKAMLINIEKKEKFKYNYNDGIPGEIINNIGCDESWAWFSTDKGLSFYNWKKYHEYKD